MIAAAREAPRRRPAPPTPRPRPPRRPAPPLAPPTALPAQPGPGPANRGPLPLPPRPRPRPRRAPEAREPRAPCGTHHPAPATEGERRGAARPPVTPRASAATHGSGVAGARQPALALAVPWPPLCNEGAPRTRGNPLPPRRGRSEPVPGRRGAGRPLPSPHAAARGRRMRAAEGAALAEQGAGPRSTPRWTRLCRDGIPEAVAPRETRTGGLRGESWGLRKASAPELGTCCGEARPRRCPRPRCPGRTGLVPGVLSGPRWRRVPDSRARGAAPAPGSPALNRLILHSGDSNGHAFIYSSPPFRQDSQNTAEWPRDHLRKTPARPEVGRRNKAMTTNAAFLVYFQSHNKPESRNSRVIIGLLPSRKTVEHWCLRESETDPQCLPHVP
nr:translation initiation factor IF-2-like [Gorilla gorilla gorilla]